MTDHDPGDDAADPGTERGGSDDVVASEAIDGVTEADVELLDRLFGLGAEQPGDRDLDLGGIGTAASGGSVLGDLSAYATCEEALEDAVSSLERVTLERDEYLQVAQRLQADFENYKRRVDTQRVEQSQRAAESLVEALLPVLDGCDAALAHGVEDVGPIYSALFGTLEKQGLAKYDDTDVVFDPKQHEAVLSEDGEGLDGEPVVVEIMRSGYQWNGRVLRPAMVKVRG